MASDTSIGKQTTRPAFQEFERRNRRGRWYHRLTNAFGLSNGGSLKEKLEEALKSSDENTGGEYFSAEERKLLLNILEFGTLRVDDVMVPRADILSIDENASLDELLKLFAQAGHSRVPVYRGSLDHAYGMVHIKDVIRWMTQTASVDGDEKQEVEATTLDLQCVDLSRSVKSLGLEREILFEPQSTPVAALLRRMQTTRKHLALIYDEFNGIDGLVSIEDLIEPLVGDIEDEHDVVEKPLIVENEDGLIVDARTPLETLNAYLGCELAPPEDDDESETVGGLVLAILGRLPAPGEHVRHPAGVDFEVLDLDQHRIGKVRIHAISHKQAIEKNNPAAVPVKEALLKRGTQAA
ncbi:MAG: HlyC/CorC family transporter [Chitinophagales bacterium]|nr:HlyC/CorC family transporter [Hyphomicrobiales bacterium]